MFYFDNAATTYPKPNCVIQAVHSALTTYGGNPGRGGHDMAMRVSEKIYSVRSKVAEFFHGEAQNVVFTQNCTMSLNMAIKGVLEKGDHIILSCLEHNAVIRPIHALREAGIIDYDIAEVCEDNDRRTLRAFERLIRDDTRAIVCTHASNVSGAVLPIERLGALCARNKLIFIVDAAQSAGVLPIDIQKDGINVLCMPGHKGLYGSTGSGVMILNGIAGMGTVLEGGTGSLSSSLEQPDFSPDRFESGTASTPGILSVGAGIDFIRFHGQEQIYRHEYALCKKVFDAFSKIPSIKLYNSSYEYGRVAPIVSFNIGNIGSEVVAEELNRRHFALRAGLHCAPLAHTHYGTIETGMVRFAPSAFTRDGEVDQFICNVQNISKKLMG